MNVRKSAAGVATLLAALALGACATIPDSGPVHEGNAEVAPVAPFEPILQGPGPEDSPAAVVTGFLTASAGGVASDFAVAREFLTAQAASEWDPTAQVTVYDSGVATPEWDESGSTVEYDVPLASVIDSSGRRTDAPSGEIESFEFDFVQGADGQWRISDLADGVVISQANFDRFFRPVNLYFATTDLEVATPELRWLALNNIATSAARELLEGPSPWLADAVRTGFPATASLAVESVVVADGVATVDLTPQSAGTLEQRALAEAQMRLTLTGLSEVSDVDVRISGQTLAAGAPLSLDSAPVPDAQASLMADGRLGIWNGDEVYLWQASNGGVPEDAYGLARSYAGDRVVFVEPEVGVQSVDTSQGTFLELRDEPMVSPTAGPSASPSPAPESEDTEPETGPLPTTLIYPGGGLVSPTFDRHGYLWTTARSNEGSLVAIAPDGEQVEVAAEWLQGRGVVAFAVSRDDTRMVMVSRSGGQPSVEVAAIVRSNDGVPLGLGEPQVVGTDVGAAVDVSWIDGSTVALLGQPEEGVSTRLWLAQVGGATSTVAALRDGASISSRTGEASLVVVSSDGLVEERSGTSWTAVLNGIRELTYAG